MAYETLWLDQQEAVLTIAVNRPEVLNAQRRFMREELDRARRKDHGTGPAHRYARSCRPVV